MDEIKKFSESRETAGDSVQMAAQEEEYESSVSERKEAINNLIWRYARGSTTLFQAEKMACKILDILEEVKIRDATRDATETLRDLGVTQDEFDDFVHADMEEVKENATQIDGDTDLSKGWPFPEPVDPWGEFKIMQIITYDKHGKASTVYKAEDEKMTEKEIKIQKIKEAADEAVMDEKEQEAQRRSFAFGNAKIENKFVTKKMIGKATEDIDAQRVKPLICECGERLDEDSWCADCMSKTRRLVQKYMHRMHEAEAEVEELRKKLDFWKKRCLGPVYVRE